MLPDLHAYLAADLTLRTLLGASASCAKIYPEIAPDDAPVPYIIYGPVKEGSVDEIMDNMTVQLSVFVDQHAQALANSVINRLKYLLDRQDLIQGQIPSASYTIYWAKHVGGDSGFIERTRTYMRAAMVAFKFKLLAPTASASLWEYVDGNLRPKSTADLDAYFEATDGGSVTPK